MKVSNPLAAILRRHRHFHVLDRWELGQGQAAMLAGILVLTLLVYLRCLGNEFVNDERWEILENHYLEQWSFLWKSLTTDAWWFSNPDQLPQSAYYRPIQNLWFALNFHLFGRNPIGWHVVKVLLHLCGVVLVFRVAQLLSRSTGVALLCALLFGLLPVNTESVVWSTGPPQAAILELAAFCLFIERPRRQWRGFLWPLVAFAGAAFSHESAVVFPVLIAAYAFLFEANNEEIGSSSRGGSTGRLRRVRRAVASSVPFFAVSFLYMVARVLVLGIRGIPGLEPTLVTSVFANSRQTVETPPVGHSIGQILMTLPTVLVHYLELLILPWAAGPAHDVRYVTAPEMSNFYLPVALFILLGLIAWLALRNCARRGLYLFCITWWLVTLAPALHVNFRHSLTLYYFHDRFEYLSSFAFCLLVADLAVHVAGVSAVRRQAVAAAALALIVLYVASVWRAEQMWHDDLTLYTECVKVVPDSAEFRIHLAMALFRRHQPTAAVRLLLGDEPRVNVLPARGSEQLVGQSRTPKEHGNY